MGNMARVNRKALRQLRDEHGYSQEELARLVNMSLRRYVDIETKSNTNPTLDTLSAIAGKLGVKVADILLDIES